MSHYYEVRGGNGKWGLHKINLHHAPFSDMSTMVTDTPFFLVASEAAKNWL